MMNPLLEVQCRFLRPCRYEDLVTVETWIAELSVSRIRFRYALYLPGGGTPVNTGSTLHAWVDSRTFRPLNLKKRFPALYGQLLPLLETHEPEKCAQNNT